MWSQTRKEEFERLYREHQPALLREACRLTGNEAAAWDLIQETYLRAWRAFGAYQEGGHELGWLRIILTRLFIDYWRRQRSFTTLDTLDLPAPEPDDASPEWATIGEEDLRRAVAELPCDQRSLLCQHSFERRSYASLAVRWRVQVATIGSRLHRIRRGLKDVLLRRRNTGRLTPDASSRAGKAA